MFNRFQPLQDEALQARVNALMQRCGFSAKGLFVMDGSRRSAHANAYFTGLGRAKRVVFYDTLLAQLEPAEVEALRPREAGDSGWPSDGDLDSGVTPGRPAEVGHLRSVVGLVWRSVVVWMLLLALLTLARLLG